MCDRPLKGFKIGLTKNNRPNYLVCDTEVKYVWRDGKDIWHKCYDNMPVEHFESAEVVKEYTPIPCGSCISCKVSRAAEMANRCMLEMNYHDEACFVTLTYDDDHIIRSNYTNVSTGETGITETLFKKHYQDFFKRLRKAYPDNNIRYVLCGEYGENTLRPHYHAIIFGYWPRDAKLYSLNHRNQALFTSEELCKLWKKGYVVVGNCTRDSANYVSRYVTKKLYGDLADQEYLSKGRIPPFLVSSKRPAIGKQWYDENKGWCFDTQISYSTPDGGISFKAPRYFKKLRDKEQLHGIEYYLRDDIVSDVLYQNDIHVMDRNNAKRADIAKAKERVSKNKAAVFMRNKV